MKTRTFKNICAIIEIGANSVKMGIFQNNKNIVSNIDNLVYPIPMGHEIFNTGKLSFKTLNELIGAINKFKSAAQTYGVSKIKVISTTVMREAGNKAYIADRVLTQNKFEVEVLLDGREKSMIYADMIGQILESPLDVKKAIIAVIGSSTIGLAVLENGYVTRSFDIPIGALKLTDSLSKLKTKVDSFHIVVEEYIKLELSRIDISIKDCDCFIFSLSGINIIAEHCKATMTENIACISTDAVKKLYKSMRSLTSENISRKYNIPEERATTFATSLAILCEILGLSPKTKQICIPQANLEKIIATHMLKPSSELVYKSHIEKSSLLNAKYIADKFDCPKAHYENICEIIEILFSKLKKIHGLNDSDKNILLICAILHSCGQFVNIRVRAGASLDIIKNLDIYGMTREDINFSALVTGHIEYGAEFEDSLHTIQLTQAQIVHISKFVAILKLANALDKSHKQKIKIEQISVSDSLITIRATSNQSAVLEELFFEKEAEFFSNIFGIEVKLSLKSHLA